MCFMGCVSSVFHASGTVLAGCSLATSLARVLLFRLLTKVEGEHPSVMVRNVIDDISVQSIGTSLHVVRELGGVGGKLIAGLQQLRVVVSEKNQMCLPRRKELLRASLVLGRLRPRGKR